MSEIIIDDLSRIIILIYARTLSKVNLLVNDVIQQFSSF